MFTYDKNEKEQSLLELAVKNNKIQVLSCLFDKGLKSEYDSSPFLSFIRALELGNQEMIRLFLERDKNLTNTIKQCAEKDFYFSFVGCLINLNRKDSELAKKIVSILIDYELELDKLENKASKEKSIYEEIVLYFCLNAINAEHYLFNNPFLIPFVIHVFQRSSSPSSFFGSINWVKDRIAAFRSQENQERGESNKWSSSSSSDPFPISKLKDSEQEFFFRWRASKFLEVNSKIEPEAFFEEWKLLFSVPSSIDKKEYFSLFLTSLRYLSKNGFNLEELCKNSNFKIGEIASKKQLELAIHQIKKEIEEETQQNKGTLPPIFDYLDYLTLIYKILHDDSFESVELEEKKILKQSLYDTFKQFLSVSVYNHRKNTKKAAGLLNQAQVDRELRLNQTLFQHLYSQNAKEFSETIQKELILLDPILLHIMSALNLPQFEAIFKRHTFIDEKVANSMKDSLGITMAEGEALSCNYLSNDYINFICMKRQGEFPSFVYASFLISLFFDLIDLSLRSDFSSIPGSIKTIFAIQNRQMLGAFDGKQLESYMKSLIPAFAFSEAVLENDQSWAIESINAPEERKIPNQLAFAFFTNIVWKKKNPVFIEALLSLGLGIEATNEYSNSLLQKAIESSSFDVAQLLIEHGANVNHQDSNGTTPLMRAAQSMPEIIELLIEKGANIEDKDNKGKTAFQWAVDSKENVSIYLLAKEMKKKDPHYKKIADILSLGFNEDV